MLDAIILEVELPKLQNRVLAQVDGAGKVLRMIPPVQDQTRLPVDVVDGGK